LRPLSDTASPLPADTRSRPAGLLERPSEDIDLFTGWNRRDEFSTAVAAVVQAYRDDGLTVDLERRYDTFARLAVSDGSHTSKVELGVDWRANEPILMAVGPVLHPDDAVANKMSAFYGRRSRATSSTSMPRCDQVGTPTKPFYALPNAPTAASTGESSPTPQAGRPAGSGRLRPIWHHRSSARRVRSRFAACCRDLRDEPSSE
jgi:hypothetical protein